MGEKSCFVLFPYSTAEIDIFHVHEITLVKVADFMESRAAYEHKAPRKAGNFTGHSQIDIEHLVAPQLLGKQ
jgi:hypothetical protein